MLVSLLNDVRALGPKGAIVDVPDGYATTFLFPEHLAVAASKDAVAQDKALDERPREGKEEREDRALAAEIDGVEVVIAAKAEKDRLAAPVTAEDVWRGLKDLGYKIKREYLQMKPIEDFGSVDIPVQFPTGFESQITVIIEAA